MLETLLSAAFLAQTLRITVPYALPALGATFSERGGVVNIALEGTLLIAAFAATAAVWLTGSVPLGIVAGAAAGMATALLHAIVTVTLRADQIVSGIGINLLAVGLTKFCCQLLFNSSSNSGRIAGIEGDLGANLFVGGTALLTVASQIVLFRTPFGLRLRAVGEHPEAAATLGIGVRSIRHLGVLISGALAGLGGAWLALDQHNFTDGMSAGRGYIALAAMIIGKWNPVGAVAACLLFGLAESLSIQMQNVSHAIQFIQLIPYLLTMVVLAGFIGRATPPAADGIPYRKP